MSERLDEATPSSYMYCSQGRLDLPIPNPTLFTNRSRKTWYLVYDLLSQLLGFAVKYQTLRLRMFEVFVVFVRRVLSDSKISIKEEIDTKNNEKISH